MSANRINGQLKTQCRASDSQQKTFIVGREGDRPLLFTPTRYDSMTGLLHGTDQSERSVVLPLERLLVPYEPSSLDWDDEPIQELESESTERVSAGYTHLHERKELSNAV